MKIRAYAKLNIGLDVTGVRKDGYHLLNMVMQTVDLYDELELGLRDDDRIVVTCNDPAIPTDERCLVAKAIRRLTDRGMDVTLRTNIPTEAGMGGGSSDAAAALIAVNEMLHLSRTREELAEIAVKLGADVPYFIYGGTMQCEGIGEKLTRLPDLPDCWFVIAKPRTGACTENIYRALDETGYRHADMSRVLRGIVGADLKTVAASMENVLEAVTVRQIPLIDEIKKFLKGHGALGAAMTGSGSAVFGIFADEAAARQAADDLAAEFGTSVVPKIGTDPGTGAGSETAASPEACAAHKTCVYPGTGIPPAFTPTDHKINNIYVVKNTKNSQIFC